MFIQSTVKHVLTQGDALLIAAFASLRDQGIYALASNYGGLVARILFQPIEESSRTLFAKLLSSEDGRSPDKQRLQSASTILGNIIRLYLLLSILAAALGPTMAPLLLRIVAGSRWVSSGAGQVLATYCYYVPLLALNGVTEAFISAVASPVDLYHQSVWMFGFSVGFAGAGYMFLRVLELGAEGLVWANVVNMLFRILWSSWFIISYFRRNRTFLNLQAILPMPGSVALGIGAGAVFSRLQDSFTSGIGDLLKSMLVAGPCILLL